MTELDATSLYVMRRHGALKHLYGEAPQLRHAEQALQDRRAFLVGDRFTTADMLLTTCLTWAVEYDVPVSPACLAYAARITSRPGYVAALSANQPPA
jgi:glutathione S-transferase